LNKKGGTSVMRLALPAKVLLQRFAFLFLVLAAFGIMLLSKAETIVVEKVSTVVVDIFAPIMDVLSRPAAAVNDAVKTVRGLADLRDENIRLTRENERLLVWQEAARRLASQTRALQSLLDFKPEPKSRSIATRVIADSGGAFVRSVVVNAGDRDGVRKGQAVVSGAGLAGRVATAGYRSARVLLITDINSRVPVLIESSRDRAILSGDNSGMPRLTFLPANASIKAGDRVVTSGHGGVFPPGLQIGQVVLSSDGVRVKPNVSFDQLEVVRLIDFASVSLVVPQGEPAVPPKKAASR
jgi:rod shape-determining protein MreC